MSALGGVTQQNGANNQTNPTPTDPTNPLANEETFLKLLVSQLQNQDPMNPTDSNQFVSQLTSYSQLEQLIGMHTDTSNLAKDITGTGSLTSSTSTSNSNSGNTNKTSGN
jgi:flagellar basal-body rod modification protein FlgD